MKRLDVDEMLDEMTPRQFDRWMAYYRIEQFGEGRADRRAAFHTAALINAFAGKEVVKPEDFAYNRRAATPVRRQSVRTMQTKFEAIAERHMQWQSQET